MAAYSCTTFEVYFLKLKRVSSFCAVCGLGLALAFSGTPAYATGSAELQAQLDEANAKLSELYSQAETAAEAVNQTKDEIETTKAEIETKQAELATAQDTLAGRVTSNYKTGGVSLVSIIFESENFEDLISRIYYASKVSSSDAEVIKNVKDIKSELSAKQAEEEALLAEQESEQAELDAAVAESESYVNSLDSELQEALAAEQAAAEAAAAEAAAKAAAEAAAAEENNTTADAENTNTSDNAENTNTNNNANSNSNSGSNTSNNSGNASYTGSLTASARSTIVNLAWSKVGNASYVYAGSGPDVFDCSGLVWWCYKNAGYSVPHSSGGVTSLTQTSDPQPGDICWKPGHVGIYVGDGMMIDAANPSLGIRYVSCAQDKIQRYYRL